MFEILLAQLSDPFRIALVLGLMLTAANTAPALGQAIPIALGVVFVAVLIPTAFGSGEVGTWPAILVGILANLIILGVVWLIRLAIARITPSA